MAIKKVCVLGAGLMGHGIAQACAQGGLRVTLVDVKDEFLISALRKIKKFLQGSVERQRITQEEADEVLNRISTTISLKEAAKDADCLIVVTEWNEFKELDLLKIKKLLKRPLIIDGRNIYEPEKMRKLGFRYISVGRKSA